MGPNSLMVVYVDPQGQTCFVQLRWVFSARSELSTMEALVALPTGSLNLVSLLRNKSYGLMMGCLSIAGRLTKKKDRLSYFRYQQLPCKDA